MKVQLIVNRLRGATRRKDKLELIRAIDDWKALGYKKCKENTQAERMLDVINLRDDLNTHLKNRNVQSLKTALNEVEFKGYASEIPYEVSQARSRIFLTNNHSPQRHHRQTTIDVQTLAEIRSYIRPPEVVHQIVVAMLLLMGVPEKNTKKWKKCQKRCVVSGKHGLHSRLHEVQPEDIDRSIAARAAELLDSHTFSEADAVSPGVGALFIWVNQIIDAVEECNKGRETPVTPARRRKQNEIFREETELSEDILHIHDDHSYSQQFVLREKTQSHFKTQSKSRLATRDTKSGKLADGKKSRSRSRPDRARGGGKQDKPNEKSKPHK